MREAQRHPAEPHAHPRNQHRALARGKHHPGKGRDVLAAHGIADHRKRLLAHGVPRYHVIWLLEIPQIHLSDRNEALHLDGARVLRSWDEGWRVLLLLLLLLFAVS